MVDLILKYLWLIGTKKNPNKLEKASLAWNSPKVLVLEPSTTVFLSVKKMLGIIQGSSSSFNYKSFSLVASRLLSKMKTQRRSGTQEPNAKKLKLAKPFDMHSFTKTHAVMEDVLMYNPEKYIGEHARYPISSFLTPAEVAPQGSPISEEFRVMACSATKWISGTFAPFADISVDGKSVCQNELLIDVPKLKTLMKPASFGSGNKTVYDENVRKAFEIEGSRIETEYYHEDDDEHPRFNPFADIQRMAPKGKKFVVKLYKMHIYEEGGKFEKHIDTLHAPNHYATLIVPLPNPYEGGQFVLEVDGKQEKPDLKFKYLLFLTDLPHQVGPVTSGTRIVLQYDVYVEDVDIPDEKVEPEKDAKVDNKKPERTGVDDEDPQSGEEWIREDSEEADPPSDETVDLQKTSYFERKEVPILGEEIPSDGSKLVPLVDEYINEHPDREISFLLTQRYPLSVGEGSLKAGDRILYDALAPHYELELGYAVNPTMTDYDGKFDGKYDSFRTINVMTYEDIIALRSFASDPNQQKSITFFAVRICPTTEFVRLTIWLNHVVTLWLTSMVTFRGVDFVVTSAHMLRDLGTMKGVQGYPG